MTRQGTFVCNNLDCGHVFIATTEITRTVVPSANPRPEVIIPLGKNINRQAIARNLSKAP